MSRTRYAATLAVLGLLAFAAVAVAKPTPAGSSTTFSAVHDESSAVLIFSGTIKSGKAVCKDKRKVLISKSLPTPPGFQPLGVATSEKDGTWTTEVPDLLAGEPTGLKAVLKSKRVGNVLCKGSTKKLGGSVGTQP